MREIGLIVVKYRIVWPAMLIAADEPIPRFSGIAESITHRMQASLISKYSAMHKLPWTRYPPHKDATDFQQGPPYMSPPPPKEVGKWRIAVYDSVLSY